MKKLATALGISILIITLSFPVFARGRGWGMGGHMGGFWGGSPGSCGQYDRGYGYQNPEQRTRQAQPDEEFYNDTASLRNEIRSKSAELEAILNSPDPDRGKAQALQKEISELQAKMDEKRLNYELEARKSAPEGSYGRSYGPGRGWR